MTKIQRREYICVNCQKSSRTLYTKYSEGVIRLTECDNCDNVVDKYIEYDIVLLVIDLLLQYVEAYRHLLHNLDIKRPTRLFVIFWFSNAYDTWIGERMATNRDNIYDLEWMFYKSVLSSALQMGAFLVIVLSFEVITTRAKPDLKRLKHLVYSTLLGFYGNVAVVLSIVFRLSDQKSYQVVFSFFLFVSHLQVQRVLFPLYSLLDNMIVTVIAEMVSRFVKNWLESSTEVLPVF